MKAPKVLTIGLVLTLLLSAAWASTTSAASSNSARTLTNRGTTTFTAAPRNSNTAHPMIPKISQYVNRSLSRNASNRTPADLTTPVVASTPVDNATPKLTNSFQGLNAYDAGLVNSPFVFEPPDQGLCAGNGYLLESVNDALQVYNTSGGSVSTPADLNSFYHYPPLYNVTTGQYGPELTDPSCYFDHNTNNWFQIVLTLDLDPSTGNLTGNNHIDIAVSQTANPAGTYNLYSFNTTDDGTYGTPVHPNCPCIGDYPHLGADKYGFYVTTNEYSFSVGGPNFGFNTAQVYAMPKAALAKGFASPQVIQFDNLTVTGAGTPGFTLWPATSPISQYATGNGGTEYFMSSMATGEANNFTGFDNRLGVWALTNTQALEGGSGRPIMSSTTIGVETYGIPQASNQKSGPIPFGTCLNYPNCAATFLGGPDPYFEVEGSLDSNDSRMQQTTYAGGKLYGALDTIVSVNGATQAGIAYFVVQPSVSSFGVPVVSAPLVNQGYLATAGNNVTYPAIGVLANGRGVMGFTLVGTNYYPSAAYTTFDAGTGAGTIHVAATGAGPQDGFTEYKAFGNPPRPRWGDYGATAVDGQKIYVGTEYIGQSCKYSQFKTDFTCGGTRSAFANWATRISTLKP